MLASVRNGKKRSLDMAFRRNKLIENIVQRWPGRKYFGVYRFIPLFFVFGACIELAMIKWRPLGVNFYDVYQKKEARKLAVEALREESQILKMPAGLTWPKYLSAFAAACISMAAGAQTVHMIYKPLKDLDDKVEAEKQKLRLAAQTQTTSSEGSRKSDQIDST